MARVVEDKDMGWKNIQEETKKYESASILVGFQEGETTKRELKGQRVKEGNENMAEIAEQNEFGTNKIPARPFMRTSFDENLNKIQKQVNNQYKLVQAQKKDADQALTAVGEFVVGLIKQKIRAIVTPPNSPVTIKLKGSSKPLIDFGQMVQSVTEKVVHGRY